MARAVLTQLMFEGAAEEAVNLYVSLFKGSAASSATARASRGRSSRWAGIT